MSSILSALPLLLALACGGLTYWKGKGACDKIVAIVPFFPKDKNGTRRCGNVKWMTYACLVLAACCACLAFSALRAVLPDA